MNPQEVTLKSSHYISFYKIKWQKRPDLKIQSRKNCIFRKVELLWKLYKDQTNKLLRYTNPVKDYTINGVGYN